MHEILAKLKDGIQEIMPGAGRQIVLETTIADIPTWDSLHSVTLQMFLEETFKTSIPLDLVQGDSTIGDIIHYLRGSGS
jgi:acyl carrier protein